MNILLLTDKPPWPGDSGGAVATQSIIRILTKKGHHLTLVSLRTLKHSGVISDIPAIIRDKIEYKIIKHNTSISVIGLISNLLFSRKPYNIIRFKSRQFEIELKSLLTDSEFDIIQFEGLAMNNYYKIARSFSKAKLVMRAHNVEHEIWTGLVQESKNLFIRLYSSILANRIKRVEKDCIDLYDGLITISDNDLLKLRRLGVETKAITLYPTFNEVEEVINLAENQPFTMGFIGSLDWRPNLNGLLWFMDRVWARVIARHPEATFIIAGRNPAYSVKKRMKSLGIHNIGSPDSSGEFLRSIDLLVVPLFSGSGIRIKILESLLNGTNVITTLKGAEGLPEWVAREILIANDADTMVELISAELSRGSTHNITNTLKESLNSNFGISAEPYHLFSFYSSL